MVCDETTTKYLKIGKNSVSNLKSTDAYLIVLCKKIPIKLEKQCNTNYQAHDRHYFSNIRQNLQQHKIKYMLVDFRLRTEFLYFISNMLISIIGKIVKSLFKMEFFFKILEHYMCYHLHLDRPVFPHLGFFSNNKAKTLYQLSLVNRYMYAEKKMRRYIQYNDTFLFTFKFSYTLILILINIIKNI